MPAKLPPVAVFLDTSCLRAETQAQSHAFTRLEELVLQDLVVVYTSDLVRRELASGLVQKATEGTNRVEKEQRRALSWVGDPKLRSKLIGAIDLISNTLANATNILNGVDDRLLALRVTVLPLTSEIVAAAWDSYFLGTLPMKSSKNRSDIPDAHIYATARVLQSELAETLHVVTGDGVLGEACAATSEFAVYESIAKFNASVAVTAALRRREEQVDAEERAAWRTKVQDAIKNEDKFVRNELVASIEELIPEYELSGYSNKGHATVSSLGVVDSLEFTFAKLDDVGRTIALIDIEATFFDCWVRFTILKADYWMMDDEDRRQFTVSKDDWDDEHVQVERNCTLAVTAVARIEFSIDEYEVMRVELAAVDDIDDVEVLDWTVA